MSLPHPNAPATQDSPWPGDAGKEPSPGWNTVEEVAQVTTVIDALLAEQRSLSAVDRFAQNHAPRSSPALAPHYRDLIPLTAPRPGEQYAFEVDLDRCSGCKGCVTACHALNGLDEDESWREIGLLVGEESAPNGATSRAAHAVPGAFRPDPTQSAIPLQQTVTTACHHCLEPGCLLGCPVLAYDKDPITGIVRHLDDQCIGCSYCIMKCPYEVPKYSARRGIVRKCDLCHGRLAEGEAPACVQACPSEAIRITLIDSAAHARQVQSTQEADAWLPDAPDPQLTIPTTRYRTSRHNRALLAADHATLNVAPTHAPLVAMLVLTQGGIGGLLAAWLAGQTFDLQPSTTSPLAPESLALLSYGLFLLGLTASVFHLGQPRKAWRIWLGWRTSWLSREAIALNLLAAFAAWTTLCLCTPSLASTSWFSPVLRDLLNGLAGRSGLLPGIALAVAAAAALLAQTMVYVDTRREFWRIGSTAPRFFGTALLLGLAGSWMLHPTRWLAVALLLVLFVKLACEAIVLRHASRTTPRWTSLQRTAALQLGALRNLLFSRFALGIGAGVLILLASLTSVTLRERFAFAILPLLLLGEFAERTLFFASVAPDKMPGTLR